MFRHPWYVMALVACGSVSLWPTGTAQGQERASGAAPIVWAQCRPGQIEVMILGTFHFAQSSTVDVLAPDRQSQLLAVLDRLERFAPDRVTVEFPYAHQGQLVREYQAYLAAESTTPESPNEIAQIGFRLAMRLGHEAVYGVDVPMNLWHDSIQVFDDNYPLSRDSLRARWPAPVPTDTDENYGVTMREILIQMNHDDPPRNSEMYARFLPLVEHDTYAGALKLRPWYDRNLRMIQNIFRVTEPSDSRVLLVVGAGHLRTLKQMLELTPQFCPVTALDYLN